MYLGTKDKRPAAIFRNGSKMIPRETVQFLWQGGQPWENTRQSGNLENTENENPSVYRHVSRDFGPETRFLRSPDRAASFGMIRADFRVSICFEMLMTRRQSFKSNCRPLLSPRATETMPILLISRRASKWWYQGLCVTKSDVSNLVTFWPCSDNHGLDPMASLAR